MSQDLQHSYEFGPYRLNTAERLLLRDGERVALPPKAFETLVVLLERHGRLVEKEELMKAVWPDSYVEEANLTNYVSTLRKALGEGQNGQSYIETVPKRGYRFMAAVKGISGAEELVLEKRTLTRIVTEEEQIDNSDRFALASERLALPGETRGWNRWWVGAAILCLILAVGFLVLYRPAPRSVQPPTGAANQPPLRSITVLPFKLLGPDRESDYLSLGMSEALIARLSHLRQLVVRPASAMQRYSDTQPDALAAAREQGTDAVLEGSVQRDGQRIRVIVKLVRVQDQAVLWSGQFDEELTNVFAVQDSIARQVVEGLTVKLSDEERRRFQKRGTESVEAYQAYLRGRYFWNKRSIEGNQRAMEYFNQAIEKDPAYAQAYAGLADAILFRGGNSLIEINQAYAKGRAALEKAIEIDEALAEPHASLGLLAMNVDSDWAEAERQYRRAIGLNPNYATAHHWYGEFLAYMGRFDEGLAEIKHAQELDPLSLIISTDIGKVYFLARQYDRAIEQCKKTLEIDPNYGMAHAWLGFSYSLTGRHEEAATELHKVKGVVGDSIWLAYLGYVYGNGGQEKEARKIISQLRALAKQTYVPPMSMVIVYTALGEKDEAFKWFDRVAAEHAVGMIELRVNPGLDSLRSDPRFGDLLRKVGFTPLARPVSPNA